MKQLLILILLFFSYPLQAYVDLFTDIGYTNIETSYNDKIDVLHLGIGSTFALGKTIFWGLQNEYKAITRLVKTNEQLSFYKNQKSVYILPVLGANIGSIIIKLSSPRLGYYLLKQEKNNLIVTGKNPDGIIITLLQMIDQRWFWGSNYSSTTFKEVKFSGGTPSSETTSNTSKMLTASLILGYYF